MEKNNSSSNSSSVCRKIRQALASNPAVRVIQRISSFNQEPKLVTNGSNSPPPPTKVSVQTKPTPHHPEASRTIPIKFDRTTPKLTENGVPKVAAKGEPQPHHVHMQGKQKHGHMVHSEPHDHKKSTDMNEHFQAFIQRTRDKLRTLSNIGRGQSNPASAPDHEAHGTNKNESQYYFSDFIHRAKKKLRTTTTVGKTSSLKKE